MLSQIKASLSQCKKIWNEHQISLQISLELQEHSAYKIFLFPRGWFYDKRTEQKLEFVDVRNGEHVSIQLSLQVEDPKDSTLTFSSSFHSKCKNSTLTSSTEILCLRGLLTVNLIPASTMTRHPKCFIPDNCGCWPIYRRLFSGFRGQDPRGISPECQVHLTLPWWDLPRQPDPLHRHQSLRDGSAASP